MTLTDRKTTPSASTISTARLFSPATIASSRPSPIPGQTKKYSTIGSVARLKRSHVGTAVAPPPAPPLAARRANEILRQQSGNGDVSHLGQHGKGPRRQHENRQH